MILDRLDVVMPTYNEGDHVTRSLAALEQASQLAGIETRLIVVDDGSDAPSAAILDRLAAQHRIQLIRQVNAGRFAARTAGLALAETDFVLLLDSRVEIDPESLTIIRGRVEAEDALVWNYDVELANPESVWAAFWFGLTAVWWRDYFTDKRRVRLDAENFDRYPKGTGAFLAPRVALLSAAAEFTSNFSDVSLASDDTRLLRQLATTEGINLDPLVSCRYWGKDTATKWARQCFFRGTTFVDGYLKRPRQAPILLAVAAAAIGGGALVSLRAPRLVLGAAVGGSLLAGLTASRCGARTSEAASVALLSVPFGVIFGAGLLRGLVLATRSVAAD